MIVIVMGALCALAKIDGEIEITSPRYDHQRVRMHNGRLDVMSQREIDVDNERIENEQIDQLTELYSETVEENKKTFIVKIKVLTGPHSSKLSFRFKISLEKDRIIIGRDPDVDDLLHLLVLDQDEDASSQHGSILLNKFDNSFWYQDLDSTNGSKVNDKTVASNVPVALTDGSKIEISCNTTIQFNLVKRDIKVELQKVNDEIKRLKQLKNKASDDDNDKEEARLNILIKQSKSQQKTLQSQIPDVTKVTPISAAQ